MGKYYNAGQDRRMHASDATIRNGGTIETLSPAYLILNPFSTEPIPAI